MRSLATIKHDLNLALKRESEHAILIGKLLTEAKKQVKHGEWYKWLIKNFAMSKPSASRYMRLYEATKSLNFSDLKIRSELLYAMFVDELFDEPVIKQIFREAKRKWVGLTRADQLQRQHRNKDAVPPDWLLVFEQLDGSICDCDERTAWLDPRHATITERALLAEKSVKAIDQLNGVIRVLRNFTVLELAEAAE
jgi:DUF3102 family protein